MNGKTSPPTPERVELLFVSVGDRTYAIEPGRVETTADLDALDEVPLTPSVVDGVVEVGGAVTAVLDTAAILDDASPSTPPRAPPGVAGQAVTDSGRETDPAGDQVVVLERDRGRQRTGLRVEAIRRVGTVPVDAVRPARSPDPPLDVGVGPDLLRGVVTETTTDGRPVAVLDVDAVVARVNETVRTAV